MPNFSDLCNKVQKKLVMIRIIAKAVIRPEEVHNYLVLAKELIEKSLSEDGCLEYDIWQSTDDPYTFTMMETWKNENAIKGHNASTHFKKIVPQMKSMRISSEVDKYKQIDKTEL